MKPILPGFPVEFGGVGEPHAAFLKESRTRGRVQCRVQEIRVAVLPFWEFTIVFFGNSVDTPRHLS